MADVLPYRVVVYGKDNEVLYDRVHDDLELWKLAPGLSIRVRDLEPDEHPTTASALRDL